MFWVHGCQLNKFSQARVGRGAPRGGGRGGFGGGRGGKPGGAGAKVVVEPVCACSSAPRRAWFFTCSFRPCDRIAD